jgi:enamine deaminase RidA (YjgF/YER057c/UK114 family)
MRRLRAALATLIIGALLCPALATAQKTKKNKKDEEPVTQTLPVLPDPPAAVVAETRRLGFLVAPLTTKGLLSQQVRDGIHTLWHLAGAAPIVKLRAFVAGTGDLRRVQTLVSEMFTEKHLALPVLSVVQVGALPLAGAQVQLEAVTTEPRKLVNPNGLAFISGQDATFHTPVTRMLPLVDTSIGHLQLALKAAGADPLRISCFLTSLEDVDLVRAAINTSFPGVPASFVQTQRAPQFGASECEAIGRLRNPTQEPFRRLNPEGLRQSPAYSQIAVVGAQRLVLAGAQIAFRYEEADARRAFTLLDKALAPLGSSLKNAAMLNTYPLSPLLAELVRKVRFDYLDPKRPPASTLLPFEGLPGMDAAFSLEVVTLLTADNP